MFNLHLDPKFVAPRRKPITKPPGWVLGAVYDEPAAAPEAMSRPALLATFAILALSFAAILAQHQWHFIG